MDRWMSQNKTSVGLSCQYSYPESNFGKQNRVSLFDAGLGVQDPELPFYCTIGKNLTPNNVEAAHKCK